MLQRFNIVLKQLYCMCLQQLYYLCVLCILRLSCILICDLVVTDLINVHSLSNTILLNLATHFYSKVF